MELPFDLMGDYVEAERDDGVTLSGYVIPFLSDAGGVRKMFYVSGCSDSHQVGRYLDIEGTEDFEPFWRLKSCKLDKKMGSV